MGVGYTLCLHVSVEFMVQSLNFLSVFRALIFKMAIGIVGMVFSTENYLLSSLLRFILISVPSMKGANEH